MKSKFMLFGSLCFLLLFSGCGLHVVVSPLHLPYTENVQILGVSDPLPKGATFLGSVFVGESGFTTSSKCTYDKVMHEVTARAQEMGGNLLVITQHIPPHSTARWFLFGGSSCHQISANVYATEQTDTKTK